jgi:predicted P-loop ATPase
MNTTLPKDQPTPELHLVPSQNAATELDRLLSREKAIHTLKSQGKTCKQIQLELGISAADQLAIKHLRETFYGLNYGSMPVWNIGDDHTPNKSSPENAMHMISSLGLKVRYNLLKKQVFINEKPISDIDLCRIQNEAKRWGLNPSVDHVDAVLKELALKDQYQPFCEWVESKPWDGTDYITALFNTLTIQLEYQPKTQIFGLYLRKWLVSIIAKQFSPGSKGFVLILLGAQGKGKDAWFQKLVPLDGCYSEGELNPSDKDHKFIHADTVLYNVAEFEATIRKKDASALKQFLTLKEINERAPYGRYKEHFKSICSFCGSVNDPQFLNDPTGSRRYPVVPISAINYLHEVPMQQVFAQALVLFRNGEQYWFDEADIAAVNEANESFQVEDYLDILAAKVEAGDSELTCTEILQQLGRENPTKGETVKMGILLSKKGIQSKMKKRNGISLKHYFVIEPNETSVNEALRNKSSKRK